MARNQPGVRIEFDDSEFGSIAEYLDSDFFKQKVLDEAIKERDAYASRMGVKPNYANLDKVVDARVRLKKEELDNDYRRQIESIQKPRYTLDSMYGNAYIEPSEYERYNDEVKGVRKTFYGAPMTDEEFTAFKEKYGK